MGVGVGGAVAGRLEVGAGADEVGDDLGAGVGRRGRGVRVEVVDLLHRGRLGQAGVRRIGRAEAGRRDGALDEPLEPGVVEPGRGRLRDAATVDDDAQPHVVVVARHVLVDAAVGEPRERVGALPAGDERLGAIADEAEHAIAEVEAALGDRIGGGIPGRHQRTPTRTSAKRAGTDGWPVWPTWIGWPLPQLAVPQNTHSSGPPTMSIDAQNRGPMPV